MINLINKILEYSAKNKKANDFLLYSILNPETNSDSPSEKSKGVRFVSAKIEIIQIKKIIKLNVINGINFCIFAINEKVSCSLKFTIHKIKIIKLIS